MLQTECNSVDCENINKSFERIKLSEFYNVAKLKLNSKSIIYCKNQLYIEINYTAFLNFSFCVKKYK